MEFDHMGGWYPGLVQQDSIGDIGNSAWNALGTLSLGAFAGYLLKTNPQANKYAIPALVGAAALNAIVPSKALGLASTAAAGFIVGSRFVQGGRITI